MEGITMECSLFWKVDGKDYKDVRVWFKLKNSIAEFFLVKDDEKIYEWIKVTFINFNWINI